MMCSSRNYPYHPPPGGQRKFRGEGAQKRRQFPRGCVCGGCLQRFFPGGLSKTGELSINNSFSVKQAISYFTVTGVSKQVLLFALIIFYLRSAKSNQIKSINQLYLNTVNGSALWFSDKLCNNYKL